MFMVEPLDFQNKLGRVDMLVCEVQWQAVAMFTMSLCAFIYNKFRLITLCSPTKIMTIGDELRHAVLSMQDDDQGRHVHVVPNIVIMTR